MSDQESSGRVIIPKFEYPSSDGEPMADGDANATRMIHTWSALKVAIRDLGVVAYVSGNLFVYPVEGEPWTRNAPDVLVAPGCAQAIRESFMYWREPATVQFAGEFLWVKRRETFESEEIQERIEFYRTKLATRELFIYEPAGTSLEAGFRFHFLRLGARGLYEEVRPGTGGWYISDVLGLEFRPADSWIRLRHPTSGKEYLPAEIRAAQDAERAARESERAARESERADREAERARGLEAEIERLRKLAGDRPD